MKDAMFLFLLAMICAVLFHFVDDPMARSVIGVSAPIYVAAAFIVGAIERHTQRVETLVKNTAGNHD